MGDALWCKYDFEVNKHYWRNVGIKKALPVRANNLVDVACIMDKAQIPFWLQGKTLQGAFECSCFLDDHDDDIGVDNAFRSEFEENVLGALCSQGFEVIRNDSYMISVVRGDRYIDVCFFVEKRGGYGYANKVFPKKYFMEFGDLKFQGRIFKIPSNTQGLLDFMYSPSLFKKVRSKLLKQPTLDSVLRRARRACERILFALPHGARRIFSIFSSVLGVEYKRLTECEFLRLCIEPENSFNWKWRKPHLDILTNSRSATTVGGVLDFIGDEKGLDLLLDQVVETDTSTPFYEPHNYDARFWQSGNNYFIYNVKYQFRRGVLEYGDANEYIRSKNSPFIYTAGYYSSLPEMTDEEISLLLKNKPIELTADAVTSGKHRVSAMIGRLVFGRAYLPFWAVVRK